MASAAAKATMIIDIARALRLLLATKPTKSSSGTVIMIHQFWPISFNGHRRNVILAADFEHVASLAFDAKSVIGGRQGRIADLIDPRRHWPVLTGLHDLADIRMGDQVAIAIHDDSLTPRADFKCSQEVRQFLQRDIDADDAEIAIRLLEARGNRDARLL